MASNRGVVYVAPGKVEVRSIDFPKLVDPRGKRCDHGVILKVVSTNICGSGSLSSPWRRMSATTPTTSCPHECTSSASSRPLSSLSCSCMALGDVPEGSGPRGAGGGGGGAGGGGWGEDGGFGGALECGRGCGNGGGLDAG